MSRPDAEREETPGPGAAARYALRALDACLTPLQRWRDRLAGPDERDDRHGRATGDATPAEAGSEPSRPSLLRKLAVGLVLLLAAGAGGGFLAYRTLSAQLDEHDSIVERMQEEIDSLRKEDARSVKLLDKFQRENAEYRHLAREAQREAENHKRRAEAFEAQIEDAERAEATKRTEEANRAEEAKRAELAAQQARRAAAAAPRAKPRTPQKTGNCAAGTAAEMAECIENFNRQ